MVFMDVSPWRYSKLWTWVQSQAAIASASTREMLLGILGHALGAPPCVGLAEQFPHPSPRRSGWQLVVYEHREPGKLPKVLNFKAHAVRPDHQQSRLPNRFPSLPVWRPTFRYHLLDTERYTESRAYQPQFGSDGLAAPLVQFNHHPSTAHGNGGLCHVAREPAMLVKKGKNIMCLRGNLHGRTVTS
jgi:hypothetical protein